VSRRGRIRYEPAALVCHKERGSRSMDRRQMDCLQVVNRTYLFRKNFAQTLRARAGFAELLTVLCVHRILNREWSGLRGLLDGMRHVRRTGVLSAESPAERPHAPSLADRVKEHDHMPPSERVEPPKPGDLTRLGA
jgi:hypothetical protein